VLSKLRTAVVALDPSNSSASPVTGVNDASGRVRWRKEQTQWRQLSAEITSRFVSSVHDVIDFLRCCWWLCVKVLASKWWLACVCVWRRHREETDDVVDGSLAAEVSLVTLDMLELITEVGPVSSNSPHTTHARLYLTCHALSQLKLTAFAHQQSVACL